MCCCSSSICSLYALASFLERPAVQVHSEFGRDLAPHGPHSIFTISINHVYVYVRGRYERGNLYMEICNIQERVPTRLYTITFDLKMIDHPLANLPCQQTLWSTLLFAYLLDAASVTRCTDLKSLNATLAFHIQFCSGNYPGTSPRLLWNGRLFSRRKEY